MKIKNIVVAGLCTVSIIGASAKDAKAEATNQFTNKQSAVITEFDIKHLRDLGFTDEYIYNKLTKNELESLKNVQVVSQSNDVKYIKTTTVYDKIAQKNKEIQTELTKEQYEREVKLVKEKRNLTEDSVSTAMITGPTLPPPDPEPTEPDPSIIVPTDTDPQGNADELPDSVSSGVETTPPDEVVINPGDSNTWYNYSSNYKKMKTAITVLSSGKYHIKTTMNWAIVPKVREVDMYALAWDNTSDYAMNYSSVYATQKYTAKNPFTGKTTSGTYTYDLSNDAKNFTLKSGGNGVMVKQNLKNNWDVYEIQNFTQTLEVTVEREPSNNTNYLNVQTGYKHQIDKDVVNLDGFSLTLGGSKSGVSGEIGLQYRLSSSVEYDELYKIYSQVTD